MLSSMKSTKQILLTVALALMAILFAACGAATPMPYATAPTAASLMPSVLSTSTQPLPTPSFTPPFKPTINSIFPLCYLEPEIAYLGASIYVKAESLPVNHIIVISVGTQQVATGQTDDIGNASVNIVIPSDTLLGLNQVSVYAEGTAVAANCVLRVLSDTNSLPTSSPSLPTTISSAPSTEMQDAIGIWESYIGLHGQKDHLVFHVITKNASFIPRSIQILDNDSGRVTASFPLQVSPIPNLCTAKPIQGRSYYRTDKVFFENLPQDFESRLMGDSFTYLVVVEQPTGEQASIAITEPPGNCTNLVQ